MFDRGAIQNSRVSQKWSSVNTSSPRVQNNIHGKRKREKRKKKREKKRSFSSKKKTKKQKKSRHFFTLRRRGAFLSAVSLKTKRRSSKRREKKTRTPPPPPPPPFCDPRNARSGRRRHSRGFLASRERAGLDVPGRAGDAARGISKRVFVLRLRFFCYTTRYRRTASSGIHL